MALAPAVRPKGSPVDPTRWRAVLERDRTADGTFVYAVSTTGIYCRPSCPSRRPRLRHVRLFPTSAEAEQAGYRACRRCHPAADVLVDPWAERIARACAYLAHVDRPPSLTTLAARFGGSPYHLQRTFRRLVGLTPRQYAEACRVRRLRQRLRGAPDVTTAMWAAGYGSSGRFYEGGASKLGMLPTAYRRGGSGMSITYTLTSSTLGRVLVAATGRGVCAVAIAGSDRELLKYLSDEYPAATVQVARAPETSWIQEVLVRLEGREPRTDLPIDVRATAFQWQVWRALSAIPRGETRTYGEIARAIGRPRAIRAVGRACATNPVAVAIPCHRAVGASGAMTGYRWGVRRKQELLARERAR